LRGARLLAARPALVGGCSAGNPWASCGVRPDGDNEGAMAEADLDRLFLRYRGDGDAAALGEVFDRAAPELLRLAMHLMRDAQEAEDVVQATFLAAIEGAESFDDSRLLMPWLTGILARQAGLARRRARRVIEPDRLAERRAPDPAQQVESHEFSAELAAALASLPDMYREVVRLHLADGKRSVDIARDLGRAPGTVRMQMHRGLDLLRRALPAGFAAGALGSIAATRGLAQMRAEVLAHAARHAAATASAASFGGMAAGFKLALLLACVLPLIAFLLLREDAQRAVQERPELGLAEQSAGDAASAPTPAVAEAQAPRQPAEARLADTEPALPAREAILLRGRIRAVAAHEMQEVRIVVSALARFAWPKELVLTAVAAGDGRFELDLSRLFEAARPGRPLEELVVQVDHPRYLPLSARLNLDGPLQREYAIELALEPAAVATGTVLGPEGIAAGGVHVALFALHSGRPIVPAEDSGTTLTDGSFRLRARTGGEYALLAHRGEWRPCTLRAGLRLGTASDVGSLSADLGVAIEGRATQAGVAMRAGALVSASTTATGSWLAFAGRRYLWNGERFERGGAIVETDADGRFVLAGLEPHEYRVGVARAAAGEAAGELRRALLSTAARQPIVAPAREVELAMAFASVELSVSAGEAPRSEDSASATVRWRQGEREIEFALPLGSRVNVSVEPLSECVLRVEAPGFLGREQRFEAPAAGEASRAEVILHADPQLARLRVSLRPPADLGLEPIRAASFGFRAAGSPAGSEAAFVRHASGSDGTFVLDALPAGAWTVSAHAGGVYRHYRDYWCSAAAEVALDAGCETSCEIALELGGRLRLEALTAAGARLPAACELRDLHGERVEVDFVARSPQRSTSSRLALDAGSACEVHPILRAGTYELRLRAEGFEEQRRLLRIEPGSSLDVSTLLLPREGAR